MKLNKAKHRISGKAVVSLLYYGYGGTIMDYRIEKREEFEVIAKRARYGEGQEMAVREKLAEVKSVADLLDEIEDENLYLALITVDRRTL